MEQLILLFPLHYKMNNLFHFIAKRTKEKIRNEEKRTKDTETKEQGP